MTTPPMMAAAFAAPAPGGAPHAAAAPRPGAALRRLSPGAALATAVAAGAALGALHGADLADQGFTTGLTTAAAELHLGPAPTATPVPAAPAQPAHDTAADAVPELAKGAHLARQSAKADDAVARFMSHVGSTAYENWCERAVENAYGTQGHYASAIEDWHSQSRQHKDWWNAPRGAMVFYNTSGDGHVALSTGDGHVVSSSAHHQVGVVPVGYFQKPLGWAPAPY